MMNEGLVHTNAADWLYNAIKDVDGDVFLASPYVSSDVCRLLAATGTASDFRWRLFTCLDPTAVANGYLSVEGLIELKQNGVNVSHVDRLHAKTFIVGSRGFLGSANLTGAGLGSSKAANFELGVELGAAQIDGVKRAISTWPSRDVRAKDLEKLLLQARRLTAAETPASGDLDQDSALALVEQLLVDARDETRTLWLKSEYGEPALDQWRSEWYFGSPAKGRPSIKPRDLVFICAQNRDCYAVVEVTSDPEFLPDDYRTERGEEADRWPWVSRTTPRFVPDEMLELKAHELVRSTGGLQNGHIKLKFDQFTYGVRSLARLVTN
ncbi:MULTISPECIES: hypothetical protein [unclassified Arthrobacter]|uniref:hypothetical protein n=1 Tax=unclassified Arthrobacter TaxID=235627 RepID=UPI001F32F353|nr:hypothetical protein [Arthrobacter sp. FW305-BF8]UKA56138.1 hypothetical protein LFT45_09615 [Arthrobacter sp. FW305-BF8]